MKSKANLTQMIMSLIEEHHVSDQQTFLNLLSEKGHHINQSTLSRNLRKLGIRKKDGKYQLIDAYPAEMMNPNLALEVVKSPPNMLVVKTLPGHASAVAYHFEANDVNGVAGTVAGNDTLFVALSDPSMMNEVYLSIVKTFHLEDDRH